MGVWTVTVVVWSEDVWIVSGGFDGVSGEMKRIGDGIAADGGEVGNVVVCVAFFRERGEIRWMEV